MNLNYADQAWPLLGRIADDGVVVTTEIVVVVVGSFPSSWTLNLVPTKPPMTTASPNPVVVGTAQRFLSQSCCPRTFAHIEGTEGWDKFAAVVKANPNCRNFLRISVSFAPWQHIGSVSFVSRHYSYSSSFASCSCREPPFEHPASSR